MNLAVPARGRCLQTPVIWPGSRGARLHFSNGSRLAAAGCLVTVFERGEAGRGASWAAAGMLAAGLEAEPGEERLLALNLEGQRLWPAFRDQLEAASGVMIRVSTGVFCRT